MIGETDPSIINSLNVSHCDYDIVVYLAEEHYTGWSIYSASPTWSARANEFNVKKTSQKKESFSNWSTE